ncbi:peptidase C25 [Bacteroidia bacterium]|nr:peptidase C25 [Bacteroidia bacterium]
MAGNSVLSSGQWVRLRIAQTGVYAVTAKQAQRWGLGDLQQVSVWGNGCQPLPQSNDSAIRVDLQQIPSRLQDGQLLFFAEAAQPWNYNPYSDAAYVYVTNSQTRINIEEEASAEASNYTSNEYDFLDYHELENINLLQSGQRFFGEIFDKTTVRTVDFVLPKTLKYDKLDIKLCAAARSTSPSSFTLQVNNGNAYTLALPASNGDNYAKDNTAIFEQVQVTGNKASIKLTYLPPNSSSVGYLDFISIRARCGLQLEQTQLLLRDAQSVAAARLTKFEIATQQAQVQVWDVSNLHAAKRLPTIVANGTVSVTTPTTSLKTLIAFTPAMAYVPEFVEKIAPQNLQNSSAVDYIIIAPSALLTQAQRLSALHRQQSGLSVQVVNCQHIYNEFSSGVPDPTAIRNYLKHLHEQHKTPRFVLLLGSGSYVNKEGAKGAGLLPTYQSDNSLSEQYSFVSDDYFALLDAGERLDEMGMTGDLDLAVGRLPAANAMEADILVHKIEQYYAAANTHWANRVVVVADDEDNNTHVGQAETLCNSIQYSFPVYAVEKIYFDKYPQTITSIGKRYPAVTAAIGTAVNTGAVLVNYVGHANSQWLSHEQVLTQADIALWNNGEGRYPLFVTATCEFSRFDNPNSRSAGENVLLKVNGGGIAMLSTTRLVYSSSNATLNREFMQQFFEKDADGKPLRIGEMLRRTKNNASTGVNQLNFTLLGDPALRLHLPSLEVNNLLLEVNNVPCDTLRALDRVRVTGSYTGSTTDTLEIAVYDKSVQKQTLGNGGQQAFAYREQNNILFKGKVQAVNGQFALTFVVPQDIQLAYGEGKITIFGRSGEQYVASSKAITVGGASTANVDDHTPPSIRLYIDNEQFVDGGITSESPLFIAIISDSSGINSSGNGIGRNMTLYVHNTQQTYTLNEYYVAHLDSYTSGRVEFALPILPKGKYTATFGAFDNCNNAAQKTIHFVVVDDPTFVISRVLNFPNPFKNATHFIITHNRPYVEMEVQVQIFALNGRLVKTIAANVYSHSIELPTDLIQWDGCDENGQRAEGGIYFYKVKVCCKTGETAEKAEKLLLLQNH